MGTGPKGKVVYDFNKEHHAIRCPGCKTAHIFNCDTWGWKFNGNYDKPTFTPSMLVNKQDPKTRCHSFVKDGNIQFLQDCFHELKGQNIPLEVFDESDESNY